MSYGYCLMNSPFLGNFRVDKKRDKLERKVLDSQERAFWDVHRPAVSVSLFYKLMFVQWLYT